MWATIGTVTQFSATIDVSTWPTDDYCFIFNPGESALERDIRLTSIFDIITDIDKDGIGDTTDNCILISNPDQADCNTNGVGDACDAINPEAADVVCDGVDNNCNGSIDEGFQLEPTKCGTGACASTGTTSCVEGQIKDSCIAGTPGTEIWNLIDDDCDGNNNEGLWSGFFQPIDMGDVLNQVKAGSAIPVKFSLGSNAGLSIFEAGYPQSIKIECNTSTPLDNIETTVTAGGSSLTYDPIANQYIYVWKTDKSWTGTCRKLMVMLIDGTSYFANFKFK